MLHITSQMREERAAAEIRNQKIQERDFRFILESQVSELNEKLEQAQKQLDEQQEVAKGLIRQLVMERDEGRSQLSKSEARATSLEQELRQEKKAAEALAHQLKAEQDKHGTQLSSFESHLQNLEQQLALAQKQFREQRAAVTRMIQKRDADKG